MHWNDGPGAVRNLCFNLIRIDVVRSAVDIDEDGFCSQLNDSACGSDEGVWSRNDFIARFQIDRHQCNEECVGAGRNTDSIGTSAICSDLSFEILDFRTKNESLRFEHSIDGRTNLFFNRRVLRLQIEQWYRKPRRHDEASVALLIRENVLPERQIVHIPETWRAGWKL